MKDSSFDPSLFVFIPLRTACLILWPDGDPSTSLLDHCYQLVFFLVLLSYLSLSLLLLFLVTYVLPMLGLSITYCHLGTVLWQREKPEPRDTRPVDRQLTKINSKTKDKRKVRSIYPFNH